MRPSAGSVRRVWLDLRVLDIPVNKTPSPVEEPIFKAIFMYYIMHSNMVLDVITFQTKDFLCHLSRHPPILSKAGFAMDPVEKRTTNLEY